MPVRRYGGYFINGYKFHTSKYEEKRATQNNGVSASFTQACFSSHRDLHPLEGQIYYYGQINDIVEISYGNSEHSFVMFDVRWCKAAEKKDCYGFQTVNLNSHIYPDERFMFASQAEQCFYVKDPNCNDVWVVLHKQPRATFIGTIQSCTTDEAMDADEPIVDVETTADYQYNQNIKLNDATTTVRADIPPLISDLIPLVIPRKKRTARSSQLSARPTKIQRAMSYIQACSKEKNV